MNLKSRKARLPIAVLGACALVTGGGVLAAGTAFADPAALTLSDGAASFGVGNFTPGNAAYALKVYGETDHTAKLLVESAPDAGILSYNYTAANATSPSGGFTSAAAAHHLQTVTLTGGAATDTFTLTFGGATTATITAGTTSATAADAQAKLRALNGGTTDFTVTGISATSFTVNYTGALTGTQGSLTGTKVAGSLSAVAVSDVAPITAGVSGNVASSANQFVTANYPGTYKFRIFDDSDANGTYSSSVEQSTPLITMNVYDTNAASSSTGDDVSPVITAPSQVSFASTFTPAITYDKSLTLADARGNTTTSGLSGALAAATKTYVDFATTDANDKTVAAATYSTSANAITFPAAITSASVNENIREAADFTGAGTFTSGVLSGVPTTSSVIKSTAVQTNAVTGVTLTATDVAGKVKSTVNGSGITTAVAVKASQDTVTYKARVNNTGPAYTDVTGKTVTFTLGGTDVAKLTTDGTVFDAANHVFSATTDANGYATLTVKNTASSPAGYTIRAASNGNNSGVGTVAVSYPSNVLASVDLVSTTSDLTQPTTATSVTVKGKLTDTFGAGYVMGSADPANVVVSGAATGTAAVASDGTFSYTYTPSTTPTAGSTATLTFTYTPSGQTAQHVDAVVQWSSAAAAAAISLTAPAVGATPTLLTKADPTTAGVLVSGSVTDTSGTALAYKAIKLSADGVYFSPVATLTSAAADDITKTYSAVTGSSGTFTAYAFYTMPGKTTITASSGTATKSVDVTVSAPTESYAVTMYDAKVKPGKAVTVTGKVTDIFGNGVPNSVVDLSLSSAALGALSGSSATSTTDGTFSQTFTAATDADGTATVTGTLHGQTTNAVPATQWLANAGLKLADGVYKDAGTITAKDLPLTILSSDKLTYGSKYYARGALVHGSGADAMASVDVYSKLPGGSYALIDTVKANENGDWSATEPITKSTYFLAKSGGASTTAAATHIVSGVILTGKSGSKGHVTLSANGGPNAKAYLYFYRVFSNGDTDYLGKKLSSASGNGEKTFSVASGTRSFKVLFKAPGTTTGSDTVKLKVK